MPGSAAGPCSSESLSRTDALYFSVTIVTTVGFGDITAKTEVARLLVAAQMFGDLILLGLGLKLSTTPRVGGQAFAKWRYRDLMEAHDDYGLPALVQANHRSPSSHNPPRH